ncbi:S-layer homology domain-containing protein, partial [Lawsonibacter sp. DFI.6.74]|nr:S-layer homology domain-containing protein [Lawsonibacter sp. DFI.6.74]MCG4774957.1 S-layer homology domain-containing protein [Lawsonibacter sp. DFI.5.51]
QQAPITSVTLTALNADGTAVSTSIPYGTTGGIKLSASCTRQGVGELSCQWYTIGGTLQLIDGATEPVYQLPADLSVGEYTYRVTFTADGYSKSADITITITAIKIDLANAQVTISDWPTDGKFRFYPYASKTVAFDPLIKAVTVTANGKEDRLSDSDFTYTGAAATQVGNYKLTITATDSCVNYKGSKTFDWEVIPFPLYRPAFQGSQTYTKTYDGTTTLPGSYTWLADFSGKEGIDQNLTLKSDDYEVTAAGFVSADAGKNKPINQTITLKNDNFVFSPTEIINVKGITTTDKTLTYTNFTPNEAYPTGGTTFNIEKATMPDFDKEVTLDIVNNHADTYTVDLSALLPKLESPRTYGDTQYEVDQSSVKELTQGYNAIQDVGFAVNPDNGKTQLTFHAPAVENQTEGSVGAIKITVTPTNYKPVTLTVNLQSVNKRKLGMFVSVATDPIVYGMTLGDIKLSAEATVGKDNQVIPGTIAWEDPLTTVPAAGRATYRWTFTPDDTMHYLTASNTITFLVDKATPTGAPTYTAITTGGKTLADAPLTPNASWPSGTIQWVDKDGKPLPASTQVQANTEYTWSFTPADADNYNGATGSVTLYSVSTGGGGGGGGSSSSSKPSTTTRPDGTKVQTETRADGTKIQTETKKDGSLSKTETKKDGSSVTETKAADGSTGTVKTDKHGQTTAETTLSSKAIEDAKKNGEAVKAPVEVEASRDSSTAPTVKIELPRNSGDTKVEIPVTNVKPGTVAVLVHPDGTEEIVKNSLPTEDGIQLTVNGGATVKIVDNSKGFIDTQDHWAKDAIDFVSARGLVSGMSATIYAPDASTTRAQLWTILARQNNADLTGGSIWYEKAQNWAKEKGISDGTNPNAAISRAQMVTMLWRAMGQSAAASGASFADVPADSYYAQAVAWAVEGGITTGVGGGRFDPNSTCTRAQIATFLWRAMAE